MSPWGRFILEHIGLSDSGVFFLIYVIDHARALWPHVDIYDWWLIMSEPD